MSKKIHRWTAEEDSFLIENYPLLGAEKMIKALYEKFDIIVTEASVRGHATELRRKNPDMLPRILENKNPWLPEEDCLIIDQYTAYSAKDISDMILSKVGNYRSVDSIMKRAQQLNVQRKNRKYIAGAPWSLEEESYLIKNYDKYTSEELAKRINSKFSSNRSTSSIYAKVVKLKRNGVINTRKQDHHIKWSKEKDEYLIEHFQTDSCNEIASKLSELYHEMVTVDAVRTRAKALRRKYGNDYVPRKRTLHHDVLDVATWIKSDGRKEKFIKIGPGKRDWISLKRFLLGEKADGKWIVFLNGDSEDARIENLAYVSQAVNSRLHKNGLVSEDPEVTKVAIKLCELEDLLANK